MNLINKIAKKIISDSKYIDEWQDEAHISFNENFVLDYLKINGKDISQIINRNTRDIWLECKLDIYIEGYGFQDQFNHITHEIDDSYVEKFQFKTISDYYDDFLNLINDNDIIQFDSKFLIKPFKGTLKDIKSINFYDYINANNFIIYLGDENKINWQKTENY